MDSGIGIGSVTRLVGLAIGLLAIAATLVLAPRADAYVYWSNFDGLAGDSLGRAPLVNPNGPGKELDFINVPFPPAGVAVNSSHIYWGSLQSPDKKIARANLDGSGIDLDRFDSSSEPNGVALSSTHAYWTRGSIIERSALGDPNGEETFVTGAGGPCGVAVNATHVFWGNQSADAIGRTTLADPEGDKDPTWIEGADAPCGVAVNGTHVYWANFGDSLDGTTIGRATLAGTGANQSFITGAAAPCGVALNATHVFWANNPSGTIGRATLAGTGADQSFITGAEGPCGVAVDTLGPGPTPPAPDAKPSNEFSFGKAKRNKRNGTAKLEVLVPGTGHLALAGNKVKPVDADVGTAARASGDSLTTTLKVKARGKARKKLKTRGKAKVAVDVTYTPSGGDPNTLGTSVKLKKK